MTREFGRVPNQVDHRRNYYERLAAGLVQVNPPNPGVSTPPRPRPRPTLQGAKPLTVAQMLGMSPLPHRMPPDPEDVVVDPADADQSQPGPGTVAAPSGEGLQIPPSTVPPAGGELPHPGASQQVDPDAETAMRTSVDAVKLPADPFAP